MMYIFFILVMLCSSHIHALGASEPSVALREHEEYELRIADHFQCIGSADYQPFVPPPSIESKTIAHAAIIALKRWGYPMLPDPDNNVVQELFPGYHEGNERILVGSFDMLCIDVANLTIRQAVLPEIIPIYRQGVATAYRLIRSRAEQLHKDKGAAALTACIETYLRTLPLHANADEQRPFSGILD